MVKHCYKCHIEHDGSFGSGKFCSRVCANSRTKTVQDKFKVSESLKGRISPKLVLHTKICPTCKTEFQVPGTRKAKKYCCRVCVKPAHQLGGSITGRSNVERVNKRSKNEILFADLCSTIVDIQTNCVMFNGWDADVVIPKYRMAVLWNGPWHYKKITRQHSLEQVQNRDRIKIKEIEACGYVPYVVRDDGSFNPKFVSEEFEKFKQWISELAIT